MSESNLITGEFKESVDPYGLHDSMTRLKQNARKHKAARWVGEHQEQLKIERAPGSFVAVCPKCGKKELYFDFDVFSCLDCGAEGSFEELQEMVSGLPDSWFDCKAD